ncbi:hypothetical protein [Methylobacterium sp. C1]|uniref:hypothetical protein n=1 Tax=Methylobacterium sp. C1 TaxID=1479019 RepID=UPI001331675F|nr:hypothetical protein [Methylobacterium sp. C1]
MRTLAIATLLGIVFCGPGEAASRRHQPRGVCVPVFIEGAGTVRLCAPVRGR